MACISPRGEDGQLAYHSSSSYSSASPKSAYSSEGSGSSSTEYSSANKDYQ